MDVGRDTVATKLLTNGLSDSGGSARGSNHEHTIVGTQHLVVDIYTHDGIGT